MEERHPKVVKDRPRSSDMNRSGVVNSGVISAKSPNVDGKIEPGAILEGKYLVGEVIGTGAFGIVYEAKNLELDEKVALKTMRPELLVDTAMVARFAREAKSAAAIKSEYVAGVYDVGTTSAGTPYIVMEYLEGKNFGQLVEESGAFQPRTAVEYMLQVCEALAVAHATGIVHRDIKPENLLLTERAGGMKIVKVLDFGISKAALTGSVFGNEVPIVKTLNLMGTPLYMSPEQVRCSDNVDVRSDIWSVGMVLYEILAGTSAFDDGVSITEICAAILESNVKPIELHRNDLPAGLVAVISKCLEKDAARRFQNVAELAMALMPFGPKRSRLNVERAVSVLQGVGQVDANIRVDSMMPPTSTTEIPSIPRPSATPLIHASGSPHSTHPSVASSQPSLTTTAGATAATPGSNILRYVAIGAVVVGLIGTGMVLAKKLGTDTPHASAAPTSQPLVAAPEVTATTPPTTTNVAAAPTPAEPKTNSTPTSKPDPQPPTPTPAWRTSAGAAAGNTWKPRATTPAAPTPPVTAAVTTSAAPAPPPAAPPPTPQPTETSKGRTFRRDF